MIDELWNPDWARVLYHFYFILTIIFLLGIICFWIVGPIEIAQICALGFMWTLFGTLLNRSFSKKRENE